MYASCSVTQRCTPCPEAGKAEKLQTSRRGSEFGNELSHPSKCIKLVMLYIISHLLYHTTAFYHGDTQFWPTIDFSQNIYLTRLLFCPCVRITSISATKKQTKFSSHYFYSHIFKENSNTGQIKILCNGLYGVGFFFF